MGSRHATAEQSELLSRVDSRISTAWTRSSNSVLRAFFFLGNQSVRSQRLWLSTLLRAGYEGVFLLFGKHLSDSSNFIGTLPRFGPSFVGRLGVVVYVVH